ncbi:MAG: MaoC family dehydratase [Paucimonas sp.]|jgi:acyl dehydratase|nr:MaoC family dehydratase [Paucimonas sp.]
MRIISSVATLREMLGQEIGVSDWMVVSQDRISRFADATGDHQWIHVDEQRSRLESPFGGTVAHGFLTVGLIPTLMESAFRIEGEGLIVNYGLNKARFPAPVPAGSRVRARMVLADISDVRGGTQMIWDITMESDADSKPVCIAEFITRHYPAVPHAESH